MDHGRIIALGTPQQLIASSAVSILWSSLSPATICGCGSFDGRFRRPVAPSRRGVAPAFLFRELPNTAVPRIFAELTGQGVNLSEFRTHSASLEDVFVGLTGRNLRDG